jgi:hypothetical protein
MKELYLDDFSMGSKDVYTNANEENFFGFIPNVGNRSRRKLLAQNMRQNRRRLKTDDNNNPIDDSRQNLESMVEQRDVATLKNIVYRGGKPVSSQFANPNIVKPQGEISPSGLLPVPITPDTQEGASGLAKRGLGLGLGRFFRRKIKRATPDLKVISIRAKQLWNNGAKDVSSWSETLKLAEKQLVSEGQITPTTYLNFDSEGNAIGFEHE